MRDPDDLAARRYEFRVANPVAVMAALLLPLGAVRHSHVPLGRRGRP